MNLKKLKTTLSLLIIISNLLAQGENNIWNINGGIAIDFNQQPTTFIKVPVNFFSMGPGASVSDSMGRFLFHTNGLIALNRLGEQMDNANVNNGQFLRASSYTTMPTLAIPFSTDKNKYYIFSLNGGYFEFIDYQIGSLYYSILDMSLDNGLGDVISEQKNILLQENLTGRLVAGKGLCGSVWVVTHEFGSNRFLSFEIIADEIASPIISEVGTSLNQEFNPLFSSDGIMKFSPDYKKLLLFGGPEKIIEVFDFDQRTGKISNPISLPYENDTNFTHTGAFSPDGKKLYVLELTNEEQLTKIFQFDFSLINTTDIIASKTLIGAHEGRLDYRNIELGPDGVIYISKGESIISGILSPNNLREACNFRDNLFVFSTEPNQPSSFIGLHNPVVVPDKASTNDSLLLPQDQQLCQNTQLNLQIQAEGDSYLWQDGSTTSDYEIIEPGTYWVEVQKGNCTFTDTLIIVPDDSFIDIGVDTTICVGESLLLSPNEGNNQYRWQDGSINANFTVTEAGVYWVENIDSLCRHRDSVLVETATITITLPEDTSICLNQNLLLNVIQTGVQYEWQDGSTQATFNVTEAGMYWVEGQKGDCSARDSIHINIKADQVFLPNDTLLCDATEYLIIPDTNFSNIIWWEAPSSGDSLLVTESGTYHALPTEENCFYSDSITVIFQTAASTIMLPKDTTICTSFLLDIGELEGQISWQDGSTDQAFLVTESGTYWVNLTDKNCTVSDTIEVVYTNLMVDLGADTTLCEGASLPLTIDLPNTAAIWQDGSTNNSFLINQTGQYWVNLTTGNCEVSDTININYEQLPLNLGNDTTICEEASLTLNSNIADADYTWQDGSNQANLIITAAGQYWLEISKNGCFKTDSILVGTTICEATPLCKVFIPNTFSPNGDGINDNFQLLSDCELMDFSLAIYDRWGNLLFSTNNIRNTWDGTQNGQVLDSGVYLVSSKYQLLNQQPVEAVKTLTIIK